MEMNAVREGGTVKITSLEEDGEQLRRILLTIVPDAVELFSAKNREYGGDNPFVLGERGQFADIWRKVGKLKRFLWDNERGDAPVFESVEEILFDLIGHSLLTIDMIRQQAEEMRKVRG